MAKGGDRRWHLLGLLALCLGQGAALWGRQTAILWLDGGRTLYVPWQVLAGRMPYRDLAWVYPPLSPYLEAGIYRLFGTSYGALQAWGEVVFAASVLLLYLVAAAATNRPLALTAAAAFAVLGHARLGLVPYSFAASYGNLLALGVMAALAGHAGGRRWALWAAGGALGLCLAAKLEFAAAAAVGTAVYLAARREPGRAWAAVGLAAALVAAVPYGYLLGRMPAATLLEGLFPVWLASRVHHGPATVVVALAMPLACLAALVGAARGRGPWADRALALGLCSFGLVLSARGVQAMPEIHLAPALVAALALAQTYRDRIARLPLLRVLVEPRAMVATLALAALVVAMYTHLQYRYRVYTPRLHGWFPQPYGAMLRETADYLGPVRPRWLVAMPDNPVFNFAVGIPSPLRHYELRTAPAVAAQEELIADLRHHPGTWVVLTNLPPSGFGSAYQRQLWRYLQQEYVTRAAWRGGRLVATGPEPPRLEDLAVLAPRSARR